MLDVVLFCGGIVISQVGVAAWAVCAPASFMAHYLPRQKGAGQGARRTVWGRAMIYRQGKPPQVVG
jgi:hypothetical protein